MILKAKVVLAKYKILQICDFLQNILQVAANNKNSHLEVVMFS
jgi:hypothetical protein